jgi:hypothetical protein
VWSGGGTSLNALGQRRRYVIAQGPRKYVGLRISQHLSVFSGGLGRAYGYILDRALAATGERLGGRIVKRWEATDKTGANAHYVGVILGRPLSRRRQYLLRHALELAFLIVTGDPEQDCRDDILTEGAALKVGAK